MLLSLLGNATNQDMGVLVELWRSLAKDKTTKKRFPPFKRFQINKERLTWTNTYSQNSLSLSFVLLFLLLSAQAVRPPGAPSSPQAPGPGWCWGRDLSAQAAWGQGRVGGRGRDVSAQAAWGQGQGRVGARVGLGQTPSTVAAFESTGIQSQLALHSTATASQITRYIQASAKVSLTV